MSEARRLTKADILQGRNKIHYVYVDELGGEIALRPLTDGEWAEVEETRLKGMKAKGKPGSDNPDMELDIADIHRADFAADCLAVAYSMADSEWNIADVKSLPAGMAKKIANEVYKITGVDPGEEGLNPAMAEQVHSFRKD